MINATITKLIAAAIKFPIPNGPALISAIVSNPRIKKPIIGVIISWANDRISAFTARPIIKAAARPRILYCFMNSKNSLARFFVFSFGGSGLGVSNSRIFLIRLKYHLLSTYLIRFKSFY